ncbi:putative pentatricopeptide repeat-containing protein At3g05240 [Momordica charantia]|uniref:Pentatricopeptide repeat-containing protein At3g05240 n=1 Tax=Momordica charantia TaxID=3673 RepID=A0A6J1DAC7_MOMCH|nr:putative pentatricopeptide repeat-containing protein At3g05240 [Momordica charantia]
MKQKYRTIISFLEKCGTMKELKQVHGLMIVTSIIKKIIPCSRIIDFCADSELGDIDYARSVFDRIDQPSVYIWNSMIKGYCNGGDKFEALFMYEEMQRKGFSPDHFTFPFVLKVCTVIGLFEYGQSVHNRILKTGFELDAYTSSCLLNMYVSCGDLSSGLKVFEIIPKWNVVAWTSLISGFVNNNRAREALKLFEDMENEGVEPNEITMATVLAASAHCRDINTGKSVHNRLCKLGCDPFDSTSSFNVILATAIIDMYAKCGKLVTARNLFDKMPQRNLVAWNSMISGYSQYGRGAEALSLFIDMGVARFVPDKATFFSVIGACTHLGFRSTGRSLHARMLKTRFGEDVAIGTALMDMYAKAGDADTALKIFSKLQKKDVMAWTTMILGLAIHGKGEEALHMFRRMEAEAAVAPDRITYIGVLWACSHLGLVEEGQKQFTSMTEAHRIEPTMEHYGCMIDLLSRAGHFEEAEEFLRKIPMQPNATIWSSVLNGCEMYGNVGLANRVKSHIAELKNSGSGVYVLLSNIYARACKWQEVKLAREMLKHRRIGKTLGHSFVEIKLLTS